MTFIHAFWKRTLPQHKLKPIFWNCFGLGSLEEDNYWSLSKFGGRTQSGIYGLISLASIAMKLLEHFFEANHPATSAGQEFSLAPLPRLFDWRILSRKHVSLTAGCKHSMTVPSQASSSMKFQMPFARFDVVPSYIKWTLTITLVGSKPTHYLHDRTPLQPPMEPCCGHR